MDSAHLEQLVARVARDELKEDGNTREQALEQFRGWILKNPDIRGCRTDDSFLLRFLRTKKFSVLLAQQMLTRFITLRQNFKDITYDLDINDPEVNEVISSGFSFVSPFRDDLGRRVNIFILRNFNFNKFDYKVMSKVFQLNMDCLMEDQNTQVVGTTYLSDMTDTPAAMYTLYPPNVLYNICMQAERSEPLRIKEFHLFNMPQIGLWFISLLKSFLSEKLQKRFMLENSREELHSKINPKVLPRELGGTMPMAEMIALWKEELLSKRDIILSLNEMQLVGDSFKPSEDMGDMSSVSGSFKKLEVD